MLIRERIVQYLFLKGVSRYRFYKETGLSNGFLDKEGAINSDNCEKICSCYKDLSPEWLLLGTGEMLRNTDDEPVTNSYSQKVKTNNIASVEVLVNKIVELSSENSLLKNENGVLRRLSGKTNVVEHKPLTEDDVQGNIAATPTE